MALLGPYSLKDYYELYQKRRDYDYLSSWQHVNHILMGRVKLVVGLIAFSLLSSYLIFTTTNQAEDWTHKILDRVEERIRDVDNLSDRMEKMSPEEREALMRRFNNPREKDGGS